MSDRHERYVSPEGNTVDCIAVSRRQEGKPRLCHGAQMDAARESFKSQIWYAEDFSTNEHRKRSGTNPAGSCLSVECHPLIASIASLSRICADLGDADTLEEQSFSDTELNRIKGFGENDIYILGRGGLVLHWQGEQVGRYQHSRSRPSLRCSENLGRSVVCFRSRRHIFRT